MLITRKQALEQLQAHRDTFKREIIKGSKDSWSVYNEGRADGMRIAIQILRRNKDA